MAARRALAALALPFWTLSWSGACVPKVEIEGAACPCPAGYGCCDTLSGCLPQGETCPDSYPKSSGEPCAADDDCPDGELCHAWTIDGQEGSQLAGPRDCRRDCSSGIPCHRGESCQSILRDGAPLAEAKTASACRLPGAAVGCEAADCRGCELSRLGKTYCEDQAIVACFVGAHPDCGLLCDAAVAQTCDSGGCMNSGGSSCDVGETTSPCVDFSCDACPDPSDAARFVCAGQSRIVGCLVADYAAGPCEKICKPVTLDCPGGSRCVNEGYARCAPTD